jgi:hypothetical protein
MSMSKKHYEAFAKALAATRPRGFARGYGDLADAAAVTQWECDVNTIIGAMQEDGNERFDPVRFKEACRYYD